MTCEYWEGEQGSEDGEGFSPISSLSCSLERDKLETLGWVTLPTRPGLEWIYFQMVGEKSTQRVIFMPHENHKSCIMLLKLIWEQPSPPGGYWPSSDAGRVGPNDELEQIYQTAGKVIRK